MSRPRSPSLSSSTRRWAIWLLAGLLLAQTVAASVLTTLCPAHVHKAAPLASGLEYFDLRRAPAVAAPKTTHILTAFGHFHGSSQPHRHYHRGDDDTVVRLDGAPSQLADEASEATFAAALAGIALLPAPLAWSPVQGRSAPSPAAGWPALTHDPEPLYKPPRVV